MKRNIHELTRHTYDVLIIGGGIYGACVAWDACLRGLSVGLVEQADFGSATSSNSLKIIHGGLRYLQHAAFRRMRESIHERRVLMQIAPHLVHPLPVIIPTYGHGMEGKEILRLALAVNDLVSFDRNMGGDPQKYIPRGRSLSKEEILRTLPGIHQKELTGGVLFYDAQVYNSERLLLSLLRSSWNAGAQVANYVQVAGFLQEQDGVIGVRARDVLTDDQFDVRARVIINTCGPWINRIRSLLHDTSTQRDIPFAKAMNIITRPIFSDYAVGLASRRVYQDKDAVFQKGKRLLFVVPWRGHSLIGTSYSHCNGNPDDSKFSAKEIEEFLDEINQAYPSAKLSLTDVSFVHSGLLPSGMSDEQTQDVQLAKRHKIIQHDQHGIRGVFSVVGVKYTTARQVAEEVVDHVFTVKGQKPKKSRSALTPVYGGDIEGFEQFLKAEVQKRPFGLSEEIMSRLVYNYGTSYEGVLEYFDESIKSGQCVPDDLEVCKAEVRHGMREEMAQGLADVIFRRTDLGAAGYPGSKMLNACAEVMSEELGWNASTTQQELEAVNHRFPNWG